MPKVEKKEENVKKEDGLLENLAIMTCFDSKHLRNMNNSARIITNVSDGICFGLDCVINNTKYCL